LAREEYGDVGDALYARTHAHHISFALAGGAVTAAKSHIGVIGVVRGNWIYLSPTKQPTSVFECMLAVFFSALV
jgi:hypothetical protein